MKRATLGSLVLMAVGLAAVCLADEGVNGVTQRAASQLAPPRSSCLPVMPATTPVMGGELIVVPGLANEKGQFLTVIDPRQRVMGVYQIDPVTGKIALRSVRKIQWDLQMPAFNTGDPLPQELQSMMPKQN